jgi:hypothetical protein
LNCALEGKSKEEWRSALKKLALDPPRIGNKTMLQEYQMAFMFDLTCAFGYKHTHLLKNAS